MDHTLLLVAASLASFLVYALSMALLNLHNAVVGNRGILIGFASSAAEFLRQNKEAVIVTLAVLIAAKLWARTPGAERS